MSSNWRRLGLVLLLTLAVVGAGCAGRKTPTPSTDATRQAMIGPDGKPVPVSTTPLAPGHTRQTRQIPIRTTTRKGEETREMEPATESRYESVYEPVKR